MPYVMKARYVIAKQSREAGSCLGRVEPFARDAANKRLRPLKKFAGQRRKDRSVHIVGRAAKHDPDRHDLGSRRHHAPYGAFFL
jgi:hypothetical protein